MIPREKLMTEDIHEFLERGDVVSAFLRAATDFELLFSEKLKWEKNLDEKLVKNWTLGRYIEWVTTLNLIDKKWHSFLKEFNEIRNKIAHKRLYVRIIEGDEELKEHVKDLVLSACKLIEETEVVLPPLRKEGANTNSQGKP